MKHTYAIQGMTCQNCANKVQKALSGIAGITNATVDLQTLQAALTMDSHIATETLQQALKTAGDYTINMLPETSNVMAAEDQTPSGIKTYKPLILIALYISGVSFLIAFSAGQLDWPLFFRSFMAGFFLVFSFFKFLDLPGFVSSYAGYDLLARHWPGYGYVYAVLELALGIAYLTAFAPVFTYIATILIMGFSAIGVIQSVLDKRRIQCACLGTVFDLPMSTVTIVEDVAMVAMAAVMLGLSFAG